MTDNSRLVVLLILVGCALLILASPIGDWLGGYLHTNTDPQTSKPVHSSPPLTILKLRREVVKSPTPPLEEDQLPPPKTMHSGALNNEEIEEAIRQRQALFQRCWTQRLKETAKLAGQLLLQFEINPRGRVQNVQVAESSLHDEVMIRCLISVLERIPFREFSGGTVTLTFPLSFE